MAHIETDYLIAGAGAVGMAFADTILSETDADVVIVDRFAKPGGHWNLAYPFVTLHQPSAFYGVPSRELASGRLDETGLNKGLADLATGAEVLAYFDAVMRETFLPSGRVRFMGASEYENGRVTSKITGETTSVTARRATVDATWLKTSVPSTHTPSFDVADGVRFVPPNDLPKIDTPPEGFTVIGGGKTGIDACLWLLEQGVSPDRIRWIVPRDGWMIDRANTQSHPSFFKTVMGAQAAQMEAIAQARDLPDLFDRLERAGVLLRLDPDVEPRMFHGATISRAELGELRRIANVVRMGRVSAIEPDRIVLAQGEIPTTANTVHVDCSASAITNARIKPIFEERDGERLITPQCVRSYQPVFSASLIAHVEATRDDDAEKNRLCGVVPLPNHAADWLRITVPFMMNQYNWGQEPDLKDWLVANRLDGFAALVRRADRDDPEQVAILSRMRAAAPAAVANAHRLIATLPSRPDG